MHLRDAVNHDVWVYVFRSNYNRKGPSGSKDLTQSRLSTGRFLATKRLVWRGMLTFSPVLRLWESIRSPLHPTVSVLVPTSRDFDMIRASIFFGAFEGAEIRALRFGPPANLPLVELGSGIGVIASHVLRKGNVSSYLAVEANRDLISLCVRNMERNNPSRVRVSVVNAAFSDGDGVSTALLQGGPRSTGYLGKKIGAAMGQEGVDEIPVVSLTDLVGDFGEYGLISDIEGAERCFLLGQDSSFERCVWFCGELHSDVQRSISIDDLIDGMVARGLDLVYRDGSVVVATRSSPRPGFKTQRHGEGVE